jgi:hypothetical protein
MRLFASGDRVSSADGPQANAKLLRSPITQELLDCFKELLRCEGHLSPSRPMLAGSLEHLP